MKDIKLFKPIVSNYPFQLGISITNRCNLNCQMCERKFYLKQGILNTQKDISLESIKKLIRKIKNKIKLINLSAGYGEPLLHKKIFEIVKEFKINNFRVLLFTNATLLDEKKSRNLLKAGLDTILFSFEAFSDKEYEKIRKGADYKKVLKNIQNFMRIKKESNYKIKTILTAVVTKYNFFKKIDILIEIAKNLSINKLEIREPFSTVFHHQRNLRLINIKNKKRVIQDFKVLKRSANHSGIEIVLPKLKIKKGVIFCPDPWQSLYLNKDGYVRLCCINYKKLLNKNIFREDLEKIWDCREMIEWRKGFLEGSSPQMCKGCPIGEISVDLH